MYSTILVPLDGSKRAEAILPFVEDLAQRYNARLVFLSVLDSVHFAVEPLGVSDMAVVLMEIERQTHEVESYLVDLQGAFQEKGFEAQVRFIPGAVVETILDTAEREGADLIAMASHGRTGLARAFYGSVAAGVLHRIDRPLLLIRAQHDE